MVFEKNFSLFSDLGRPNFWKKNVAAETIKFPVSLTLLLQLHGSNPQLIRLNIIVALHSTANYRAQNLQSVQRL